VAADERRDLMVAAGRRVMQCETADKRGAATADGMDERILGGTTA